MSSITSTSSTRNINSLDEWKKAQASANALSGTSLGINDFYKLLAAQLQNQTMDNAMENSEMMNQMTQMTMMQAMQNMSVTINDLSVANKTSYAASMIGRTATFATITEDGELGEDVTGVITSVDLSKYVFYLDGDKEKAYPMNQLMSLHEKGSADSSGSTETEGGEEPKV